MMMTLGLPVSVAAWARATPVVARTAAATAKAPMNDRLRAPVSFFLFSKAVLILIICSSHLVIAESGHFSY
jgi:hypothetical protein